jgi:hypothetical protein
MCRWEHAAFLPWHSTYPLEDPIDLAGSDVVLHLPFGTSLPARVCWRTDTDVGFEFDHACFIPFELPQQGQHQTAPVG